MRSMRKLLRKAHYGTTCPGAVHVPQKMRISLASNLPRARIDFTPSYLDNSEHSNQRAGLPKRQAGRKR